MAIKLRIIAGTLVLALAASAGAGGAEVKGLVKGIYPIPAATGNEEFLAAGIAALLPRGMATERDNLGGLYARAGSSGPALTVLAPLDEFGYVVSSITDDGYLRLDRAAAPPVAIADSFLLGRSVAIVTGSGRVEGLVCQPSLHLMTPERRVELAKPLTLDYIFVDVGARSEEDVSARGIRVLDPVTIRPELAVLAGERLAGPGLGQKAVCAALLAVARDLAADKGAAADLVWSAQSRFIKRAVKSSLGALRVREKLSTKTALVLDIVPADRDAKGPSIGRGPVISQAKDEPSALREAVEAAAAARNIPLQFRSGDESPLLLPFLADGGVALVLGLPVRYAGTPGEVVDLKDVQRLADLVAEVIRERRQP
jgi:putative aminopeptidase FrvX